ncbi:MAG TPA: TRAP transporter large permease, partial [Rhodospirillaceae bacterium]|nr:TRAP transporter large permease [Rhodospirillaceae bacterium]
AGGNLGSIVPPSIVMVIYAILAKQFILDVFVASIIPIILTVMAMLATIAIVVRLRPDWAPLSARATWLERLGALRKAWAAGILVFVVLGGIYGGVFTVTEGASVGAIAALGIALVRRRMSLADFWKALLDAAQSTAAIYIIIIGASVFAYFVTFSGLSESFVTFLQGTGLPPLAIIFMILLGYIILGSIFETISAMLITLPFVLPLIIQLGYDPIWWGIINVAIIELGMITPPIGMNVMLLHSMTPSVPLRQIYTGVAPFILCNLLVLLVLVLVPDISLILLHWMN